MEPRENLTLIDIPLNILGLEVFDFVLAFLIPSPVFLVAMFYTEFLFLYLLLVVGTGIFLRILKRDRGFGYTKRLYVRLVRKAFGQRKVIYA